MLRTGSNRRLLARPRPMGVERRTLADTTFAHLRAAIISGALAPGTPLPLDTVARDLAVSHTPVREAIRRLGTLGLVERRPHHSATVTEVSGKDLRDVFQTRFALESLALALAVTRWTDAASRRASAALRNAKRTANEGDFDAATAADQEFHLALYQSGGSSWLLRLIRPLWDTSERYHRLAGLGRKQLRECEAGHGPILDACLRLDSSEATHQLCKHLALSADLTSEAITGSNLFPSENVETLQLEFPLHRSLNGLNLVAGRGDVDFAERPG